MKLKCIKNVVMLQTAEVAFKAGEYYDFHMNDSGEILRATDKGIHMFRNAGPDAWYVYFEAEPIS
jgi:hypothetical protein